MAAEATHPDIEILAQERKWLTTGREVEVILLVALSKGIIVGSSAIRIDDAAKDD